MSQRVYISGPMTGRPQLNFPAFHHAADELRARGLEPVNPAEINLDPSAPWEVCLRADIKALCDCDMLVLLPGWEDSRGAQLELHVAHRLGIRVRQLAELLMAMRPEPKLNKPRLSNPCRLIECLGKPRCGACLAFDQVAASKAEG